MNKQHEDFIIKQAGITYDGKRWHFKDGGSITCKPSIDYDFMAKLPNMDPKEYLNELSIIVTGHPFKDRDAREMLEIVESSIAERVEAHFNAFHKGS